MRSDPGTLLRRARLLQPAVMICALALLPAVSAQAPAADGSRTEAARRASDRLRALQREADALVAQERTLLGELRKLELDRQISIEQIASLERERVDTEGKLAAAEKKAAELASRADAQLPEIESRLVQLYKLGRTGYWRLLLNADDLQSLGRAYRAAATLSAVDRARLNEYYSTLDALARERKALHARAEELQTLRAEALRARAALDKAVLARTALVKSIDARRDLNAQLMGELQTAQERLQSSLSQLGAGASIPAMPLRPFQGHLPWPSQGSVSRRFGRGPAGDAAPSVVRHGMDLALPEGEPVRSVHEGAVAYADHFAGYGNLVILDHGSRSYSLYGYLGELTVERGERVDTQAVVGRSGRDPSGNPALYFELRVDGAAVDPLQWLRKSR